MPPNFDAAAPVQPESVVTVQVRLPLTHPTTSQSDLMTTSISSSSSSSNDCINRFAALIPADELTARVALGDDDVPTTESDGTCVWQLVHCRSETEGRPETVFQLAWYKAFYSRFSVVRRMNEIALR